MQAGGDGVVNIVGAVRSVMVMMEESIVLELKLQCLFGVIPYPFAAVLLNLQQVVEGNDV